MKQLQRGILIAVEGIDGSGKSTLALNIAKALTIQSWPILLTREPGDSPVGAHIRSILHDPSIPKAPKTEFLLYAADRAQHMSTVVLPALRHNQMVISDRFTDSSVVYQGYVRGLDVDMIKKINAWATEHHEPDIVLYVHISAEIAHERLIKRYIPLTSIEQEPPEFFQKAVEGFDLIVKPKSNTFVLDGTQTADQLSTIATEIILSWIQTNKLNK